MSEKLTHLKLLVPTKTLNELQRRADARRPRISRNVLIGELLEIAANPEVEITSDFLTTPALTRNQKRTAKRRAGK